MGVDLGDFDGDGRPDLFYATFAGQDDALQRNEGKRGFRNVTGICGLNGVTRRWVGFGTALAAFSRNRR